MDDRDHRVVQANEKTDPLAHSWSQVPTIPWFMSRNSQNEGKTRRVKGTVCDAPLSSSSQCTSKMLDLSNSFSVRSIPMGPFTPRVLLPKGADLAIGCVWGTMRAGRLNNCCGE
jgi:hypothetical protein